LAGEFFGDLIHVGSFVVAIATPGGPEFEEHDFAFDGFVVESFSAGGDSVEPGRGLLVSVGGQQGGGDNKNDTDYRGAGDREWAAHAGNVSQKESGLVTWLGE
jgi:hypothetical protein